MSHRIGPLLAYAAAALVFLACTMFDASVVSANQRWLLLLGPLVTALCVLAMWDSRVWVIAAAAVSVAATISIALFVTPAAPGLPQPILAELFALLVTTGDLCRRARSPRQLALAAAPAVALALLALRIPNDTLALPLLLLAFSALAIGVGTLFRFIEERRNEAVVQARSHERLAMSRDLHDVIAYHLTGVVLAAQSAQYEGDAGRLHSTLSTIETSGLHALDASREMVTQLRRPDGSDADASSTRERIEELVEEFTLSAAPVQVLASLPDSHIDPSTEMLAYLVVKEALTNIRRHARDYDEVHLVWTETLDAVRILVTDNGRAESPDIASFAHGAGVGLTMLRERVVDAGGALFVGPGERGWEVRMELWK